MIFTDVPYRLYRNKHKYYVYDSSYGDLLEIEKLVYEILKLSKKTSKDNVINELKKSYSKEDILNVFKELEANNRKVLNKKGFLYDLINRKKNFPGKASNYMFKRIPGM